MLKMSPSIFRPVVIRPTSAIGRTLERVRDLRCDQADREKEVAFLAAFTIFLTLQGTVCCLLLKEGELMQAYVILLLIGAFAVVTTVKAWRVQSWRGLFPERYKTLLMVEKLVWLWRGYTAYLRHQPQEQVSAIECRLSEVEKELRQLVRDEELETFFQVKNGIIPEDHELQEFYRRGRIRKVVRMLQAVELGAQEERKTWYEKLEILVA